MQKMCLSRSLLAESYINRTNNKTWRLLKIKDTNFPANHNDILHI